MTGQLLAVVGPSGVGKDSVMAGMVAADPSYSLVRRVITRAPGLGGEDYDAVTPEAFAAAVQSGAFCVHWQAHGLSYGLPVSVLHDVRNGAKLIANFSRKVLAEADALFDDFRVLNITADPEILAARLADRGRETPEEIAKRLAEAEKSLPAGLNITTIRNDGPLGDAVAAALQAVQAERG